MHKQIENCLQKDSIPPPVGLLILVMEDYYATQFSSFNIFATVANSGKNENTTIQLIIIIWKFIPMEIPVAVHKATLEKTNKLKAM